jgi:pullulanase
MNTLRVFCLYLIVAFIGLSCAENDIESMDYDSYPYYIADDLGLIFNRNEIKYRVWSPTAEGARLNFYNKSLGGSKVSDVALTKSNLGTWMAIMDKSKEGLYYTVQVKIDGKWLDEVPGPYARAVGTNGQRGQIVDPSKCNPAGWRDDKGVGKKNKTDALIYEVHIRDFSIHPKSGMKNKGKYLAFTEAQTTTAGGTPTGLNHLKDLGVTHVHLLPTFDYLSVDESKLDTPQFNWGYDPQNYNVPEGSYSTNPADARVRIEEFKSMVMALHKAGIGVIMDVVYNHTGRVDGLSFEETVPGYYYRHMENGDLSNASGCGNEIASERSMVRKFIVNSLKYWMSEYHIDGFRFDLMGIHDQETMNLISTELSRLNPDVLLYGEGWTAGDSPLPENQRALKKYTHKMPGIAAFSDDIRDGVKGHWYDHKSKGFVSGNLNLRESVKFGIVGATSHSEIDYNHINNSDTAWAVEPGQCVCYVSCHDNHTLYDKLKIANPKASEEDIEKMHILSNAIVLTSQGIPFLHAGVDFMRTKDGVENSYQSPDSINQIVWSRKEKYAHVYQSYKDLVELRKEHPAFRLGTTESIQKNLHFLETDSSLIAYTIQAPEADSWDEILMIFNGSSQKSPFKLPEGLWQADFLNAAKNEGKIISGSIDIDPYSFSVLYKNY